MKLIWTYSSKLNRSNKIDNHQMLSLFKHSIECGKQFHSTCVYTDVESKSFFEDIVDEVKVLPDDFDYYFMDDIKFYVIMHENNPFTLIDGDLFLKEALPTLTTKVGMEIYVRNVDNTDYLYYNKILKKNNVYNIIPYWETLNGYYNLGLISIFESDLFNEFYTDYNKLKEFYKTKIENIHLNRFDERVEISLCTHFFTLYCSYKNIDVDTYDTKLKYQHLAGPNDSDKLMHIFKDSKKTLI